MPPRSQIIGTAKNVYKNCDDAFRIPVVLRSRQSSRVYNIEAPWPIWLSAGMTFTELKAYLAGEYTMDPNQIQIEVHWLLVGRGAGTLASEPTAFDEEGCSDLLGSLKDRMGLDQLCVYSWEDVFAEVEAEAHAAS